MAESDGILMYGSLGVLALTGLFACAKYNEQNPTQPVQPAGIVRSASTSVAYAATVVDPGGTQLRLVRNEIAEIAGGCAVSGLLRVYDREGKATNHYEEGPGAENTGTVTVIALSSYQKRLVESVGDSQGVCFTTPDAAHVAGIKMSQALKQIKGCAALCRRVLRYIVSPSGTQVQID